MYNRLCVCSLIVLTKKLKSNSMKKFCSFLFLVMLVVYNMNASTITITAGPKDTVNLKQYVAGIVDPTIYSTNTGNIAITIIVQGSCIVKITPDACNDYYCATNKKKVATSCKEISATNDVYAIGTVYPPVLQKDAGEGLVTYACPNGDLVSYVYIQTYCRADGVYLAKLVFPGYFSKAYMDSISGVTTTPVVNPVDTLNQFITNLQSQITSLKAQITTLNGTIVTKDASIANLTTVNANLTTSNTAKDKQITSLTADGVTKDASIKSLTAAGVAKDQQITDLTKQNATITTSNTNLLAENANKDAEIVALTTTNTDLLDSLAKWPAPIVVIPPVFKSDLQPVVDSLQTLVISKDVTIGSLSAQLGKTTDSIATLVATGESFKSQLDVLIGDTAQVSITLLKDATETAIVTPFGEGEYEIRVSSTPSGLLKVATDGTVFVSIVDLQGKALKSESADGEVTIQITNDGVYFAHIQAQTSLGLRTKTYKFIVTSSLIK